MSEYFIMDLSIVVCCVTLAGVFACIAAVVWEPGARQGVWVRVQFFAAVVLATTFAVASLIVPALEL
ncbi:hypothetical protein [Pseudomonas mediterranea]|uniref:hypothetical protein n=1 Tax=Pseudomonas mediterranea TaxID=183795 RepID=UPI0006D8A7F5|nr:hypothetical protein [Pseudomonas mediterranea]